MASKSAQVPLPGFVDWRRLANLDLLPIWDQGLDDSCWAVATADWLTILKLIWDGTVLHYSPQEVIHYLNIEHNIRHRSTRLAQKAFRAVDFTMRHGLPSVEQCPYVGVTDTSYKSIQHRCPIRHFPPFRTYVNITMENQLWHKSEFWTNTLLETIRKYPVLLSFNVGEKFRSLEVGDIYSLELEGPQRSRNDKHNYRHILVCTGFNRTSKGQDYYCVRNSHSKRWANNGYGRMLRNQKAYPVFEVVMVIDF